MFDIIPGKKNIGAEIICDLKKINKYHIKKIKSALQKYGMIFFRKQNLSSKNYIKFAKNFGKLAEYPRLKPNTIKTTLFPNSSGAKRKPCRFQTLATKTSLPLPPSPLKSLNPTKFVKAAPT